MSVPVYPLSCCALPNTLGEGRLLMPVKISPPTRVNISMYSDDTILGTFL